MQRSWRFHFRRRSAIVGLAALLLAACGGAASSSPSASGGPSATSAAASSPKAGSAAAGADVVIASPSFGAENFDPSQGPNLFLGSGLGGPIYEQLFTIVPPNGALKPYLAESATMAPDTSSWTIKLRKGIKFSNGDPMTADDVKFSLERYISKDSKTASASTFRKAFGSIDVVDPLTVKISMKAPILDLPNELAYPGNEGIVLPSKYIKQVGWKGFADKPIGSGPYVLSEHKAGQSVTYTPNPNYWRSKPTLKSLQIVLVSIAQTRIAMVESGKADVAEIGISDTKSVQSAGFKTLTVPNTTTWSIYFIGARADAPDNPLKKLEVRKAFTLAIDKKALLDGLVDGQGSTAEIAADPAGTRGSISLPPTPYDPGQAKQLLKQAGYPNGINVKYWATDIAACNPQVAKTFGEAIASYWEKAGIHTEVVPQSFVTLRPKIYARPLPAGVVGTLAPYCLGGAGGAALNALNQAYYGKGPTLRSSNVADDEIAHAFAAKTLQEQYKWTGQAYKKLYDNYAGMAVFNFGQVFIVSKKAESYPITKGLPTMTQWWVKDVPTGS